MNFLDTFLSLESSARQTLFQDCRIKSDYFIHDLKEARKPVIQENRERNRYSDVLAPSETGISLFNPSLTSKNILSTYINANKITSTYDNTTVSYCVGQYPLNHTQSDFWNMIQDQQISIIVTLSRLKEGKLHQGEIYWPTSQDCPIKFDNLLVKLVDFKSDGIMHQRLFEVNHRLVHHIEFLQWPDHDVCTIDHLDLVFQKYHDIELDCAFKYIHCSAGIGRTGVFCVIDRVIKLLKDKANTSDPIGSDDLIVKVLLDMRKQRPHLIQTFSQFELCYLFVAHYLRKR